MERLDRVEIFIDYLVNQWSGIKGKACQTFDWEAGVASTKSEIERIMEQPANIHNQNNLEDLRALIGNLETIKNEILKGRNKQATTLLSNAIRQAEKIRI